MMKSRDMERLIKGAIARHLDMAKTLVFVFGSRANGHVKPSSDFDVGLYAEAPIDWLTLGEIKEELGESDLPVTVDLVDFSDITEDFKRVALKRIIVWNQPKKNLKLKLISSAKP